MILKLTQRQIKALDRHWKKSYGQGIVCEPRIRGNGAGYLRVMYLNSFEFTRLNHMFSVLKKRRVQP